MVDTLTKEQKQTLKRGKAIRTGKRNKSIEIDRLIAEAVSRERN